MEDQTVFDIDPDVLAEYLDEANDMLDQAVESFLKIEQNAHDHSAIDLSFRVVHTIKGNSGFFNLLKVKNLAHAMEDLMNLYRNNQLMVEPEHITALLQAAEIIKNIFSRVNQGLSELDDDLDYLLTYDAIHSFSVVKAQANPLEKFNQLFEKFADNFYSEDDNLQNQFYELIDEFQKINVPTDSSTENSEQNQPAAGSIGEKIITIITKGLDLSQSDDTMPSEEAVKVHELLLQLKAIAVAEDLKIFKDIFELYDLFVPRAGFTAVLGNEIVSMVKRLRTVEGNFSAAIQSEAELKTKPDAPPVKSGEETSEHNQRSMRVNEESIDKFIDHIGELVIIGESYYNLTNKLANDYQLEGEQVVTDLRKSNETFATISENLQYSILEIRKVAIGKILQKAPKIIREIAVNQKKNITVSFTGEQIMLDKSLAEPLDGALVHIFRNAADHGIETIEDRKVAGKDPTGKIEIKVTENDEFIFITISDNGKGIDPEKIMAKAVQKNLIDVAAADKLTRNQVLDLLFLPGLSTSEQVSDVSGRGVGMDVVKQNIISMNGRIAIDSKIGEGSSFKITLPKSVLIKIINGFVVRLGSNKFILPMDSIGESMEITTANLTSDPTGNEYALINKHNYPVLRLNSLFNCQSENREKEIGVILSRNGFACILMVDEIIGILKVVIKEIENLTYLSQKISGFALLGDESIASVIDLDKLEIFNNS